MRFTNWTLSNATVPINFSMVCMRVLSISMEALLTMQRLSVGVQRRL